MSRLDLWGKSRPGKREAVKQQQLQLEEQQRGEWLEQTQEGTVTGGAITHWDKRVPAGPVRRRPSFEVDGQLQEIAVQSTALG